MHRRFFFWPLPAALLVLAGEVRADSTAYVPRGASWRYFRGVEEASSPDIAAWRSRTFDDAAWATGPAPFGYGDAGLGTDLNVQTPRMQGNYSCLYLRTTFEVSRPDDAVRFLADVDYDDGFIVWINGVEVVRENAPATLAHDGLAPLSHESGTFTPFDLPAPSTFLVSGTNVIAVQAFNQSLGSSDFEIDLDLLDPEGPDLTPPSVESIAPTPGTVVRGLTRIDVTFTEEVQGVDAGDLLVGESPALSVSGSGSGPYSFSLGEIPAGQVLATWKVTHGILDLAAIPNRFGGGSWTYTLDPSAPAADLVIAEFLAANRTGLADEDGEAADWIEIWNRGAAPVDLSGWALTDDPGEPGRWTFPARTLGPDSRLVVFASGKDRRPAAGNLHANFKLDSGGEYLGLWTPDVPRAPVSEYSPRYPVQRADLSYGLAAAGERGYFDPPTPGAPNGASAVLAGIAANPTFYPPRGFFDEPVSLQIVCPTSGAAISYTLDGSEPIPGTSPAYTGPLSVAGAPRKGAIAVRAVATKAGFLPSEVVTHTYVFPQHVLTQPANPDGFPAQWGNAEVTAADYAMDSRVVAANPDEALEGLLSIPTLSLVLDVDDFFDRQVGIYSNPRMEGLAWERSASAELLRADGKPGFQVNCGLRIQGGTSTENWKSLKLSLRLLFRGDYGPRRLTFPLFPDSAVGSFDTIVLDAHLNLTWNHPQHAQRVRSQYVRDIYVCDLQNATGSLAPHGVFAHVYVNGLYWGVYDVHERPDESFAADHLGGSEEEYDVYRHNTSTIVAGNSGAWTEMFRRASAGLADVARYLALGEILDIPDLADYMLVNIFTGNDDWAHQNWYAARRRVPGAGFRFFSWDAEHVLKDVNLNQTGINNAGSPAYLYDRLKASPEFRLLFADRAHRHFFHGPMRVDGTAPAWDPAHPERNVPAALYDRRIDEIDPAIRLESARWGDCRRPAQPYTRDAEWLAELNWLLKTYFPLRSNVVLGQLRGAGLYPNVDAPILDPPGGEVAPGGAATLSLPAGETGTIYFTADGSDPRVFGTGAVAPTAQAYTGSISISDTTRVKARTLSGAVWSALEEGLFTVSAPADSLRIAEIFYNPPGEGSADEFVEIHNAGLYSVDLSGLAFTGGISFSFPEGTMIAPGGYLVLAGDRATFEARNPQVPLAGEFEGSLDNGGEEIVLTDRAGAVVLSAEYGDEGFWPRGPDGYGYSLVPLDLQGDPGDPLNWRASALVFGSPGREDPAPPHGPILIHEVLPRPRAPREGAIELYNPGGRPTSIGGWFLSDSRESGDGLAKYRIPDGTLVPAGGYAVLYEASFGPSFRLSPTGGEVYLTAVDASGDLTGFIAGQAYPAAEEDISFGTIQKTAGLDFAALEATTFGADGASTPEGFREGRGAANAPPRIGPVVLSEIAYSRSTTGAAHRWTWAAGASTASSIRPRPIASRSRRGPSSRPADSSSSSRRCPTSSGSDMRCRPQRPSSVPAREA
jgi:hypothetical protein